MSGRSILVCPFCGGPIRLLPITGKSFAQGVIRELMCRRRSTCGKRFFIYKEEVEKLPWVCSSTKRKASIEENRS